MSLLLSTCDNKTGSSAGDDATADGNNAMTKDTFTYAYKASYSSDIIVSSHPEYTQKVLTVWENV